jgi:hypothetical protein
MPRGGASARWFLGGGHDGGRDDSHSPGKPHPV